MFLGQEPAQAIEAGQVNRLLNLHKLIQAAAAKTFQVERHKLKAQPPQLSRQLAAKCWIAKPQQLLLRNFDAGQIALVVADP